MTDNTAHSELINVLWEFYTLLLTLGAVPAEKVQWPDPNTGVHPDGAINTRAAEDAGYTHETVKLMNALPYLAVDRHEMFLELLPSTYPISYLGADLDEGYFRGQREMLNDAEMPATAVRLSRSEIYGTEFIYHTATSYYSELMMPWKPIDNPDEEDGYSHVAGGPPRQVFSPVLESYRRLEYLATPRGIDFSPDTFAQSGGVLSRPGVPRSGGSGRHHMMFGRRRRS